MPRSFAICAALALCAALPAGAPAHTSGTASAPRAVGTPRATGIASAGMASTSASFVPSFSPDRLGVAATLKLAIDYAASLPHRVPAAVTHTIVHLPAGLSFNLKGVGMCSRARAVAARCPASTRVGTGSTLAEAHLGSQNLNETATVTAYRGTNQGGHPTLLIAGQGLTPLIERVIITGVLERDHPPYGVKLVMTVPPIPTLPTEPDASIVRFSLTIGGARKVVHLPSSCPAGGLPFSAEFTFSDGTSVSSSPSLSCP